MLRYSFIGDEEEVISKDSKDIGKILQQATNTGTVYEVLLYSSFSLQ